MAGEARQVRAGPWLPALTGDEHETRRRRRRRRRQVGAPICAAPTRRRPLIYVRAFRPRRPDSDRSLAASSDRSDTFKLMSGAFVCTLALAADCAPVPLFSLAWVLYGSARSAPARVSYARPDSGARSGPRRGERSLGASDLARACECARRGQFGSGSELALEPMFESEQCSSERANKKPLICGCYLARTLLRAHLHFDSSPQPLGLALCRLLSRSAIGANGLGCGAGRWPLAAGRWPPPAGRVDASEPSPAPAHI